MGGDAEEPKMAAPEVPAQQAQEVPSTSVASSIEGVSAAARQSLLAAKELMDSSISATSSLLLSGAQQGASVVREGMQVSSKYLDEGQALVNDGLAQLTAVEDQVFGQLKGALSTVANTSPYITYPALTVGTLLLLPGTRRLLYRSTLGRLRNPDAIYKAAEGRVEGLRSKVDEYGSEAKKLQERMVAAEEEMNRGISKLRATRLELQRLESVMAKSERTAQAVLTDLRSIKKVEQAPKLRAEAANQLGALRSQHAAIKKYIYRIASKDI